jgi:uncharacterized membrane-anchored protein YjiN (DUF445 family)
MKRYTEIELKAKAQEVFDTHPNATEVHITDDGMPFIGHISLAKDHAMRKGLNWFTFKAKDMTKTDKSEPAKSATKTNSKTAKAAKK